MWLRRRPSVHHHKGVAHGQAPRRHRRPRYIGTNKHLPGLATQADKAEVVAFCDLEESKAQAARDEFGSADAYVTTDYRDLLADESIDVIHVCSWNTTHREITVAALEAGKHVMCEKPMAVTGKDAREMAEAARRTGKKLSVGFQYRFRQDVQFLKAVVDEAASARSTRRRRTRCVVAVCRPGACSPTRRSRAAAR